MIKRVFAAALTLSLFAPSAVAQTLADPAFAFGKRGSVRLIALSPDGRMLAFVQPAAGQGAVLYTVDLTAGSATRDLVGAGPHVREGSPAQKAAAIRAPVLMFHGTLDRNVGVRQSRLMRDRLREAGRAAELVEFEGLDHQLEDRAARTRLLRDSDAFLRRALGIQ